jgi:PspAA-like protein
VIVRVAGQGQFRIPDGDQAKLNELDNAAVEAVEAGDEAKFQELWGQMLALVEADGNALDEDELVESDIILPPRDITIDEARHEFTGEGLIPD